MTDVGFACSVRTNMYTFQDGEHRLRCLYKRSCRGFGLIKLDQVRRVSRKVQLAQTRKAIGAVGARNDSIVSQTIKLTAMGTAVSEQT